MISRLAISLVGKLLRILLTLIVLLPIAAGVMWALLHNEAMTARILPMLPVVKVLGPQGALLGDFKAKRVDVALPRGGHVIVENVAWKGLEIWPDLGVRYRLAVKAEAVSAQRVDFKWVPGPPSPSKEPLSDLDLPLSVRVGRVQVGEAHSSYWGDAPLRSVDGELGLQVPASIAGAVGLGQRQHAVKLAGVAWQGWALSGRASAGTSGKMPIDAALLLKGRPHAEALKAVQADLNVQGPLRSLHVKGRMSLAEAQAASGPQRELGRLELDADVAALDAWPLARLRAVLHDLDIAALHADLPSTALSGEAVIEPVASKDLQARLNLSNRRAGPWDEALLPVRAVQGQISLLNARGAAEVAAALTDGMLDVALQLPSVGQADPGALLLKGGWGANRTLRADWRGLTPRALHHLAPPLQLQGNVIVKPQWRRGLSQLAETTADVTVQSQGLYGRVFAGSGAEVDGKPVGKRAAPKARDASVPAESVPVAMNLTGRYEPGRVQIRQWRMQAQEAQAAVDNSMLQWGQGKPWQLSANLAVQAFDPKVWLPWPAAVTGVNRVSGKAVASVNGDWRGQIKVDILPSTLGGIPLQGHVAWLSPPNRQQMSASVDLDAGGNAVNLKAELPWRRDAQGVMRWGEGASWQGRIQAPALHNLQAVAPLLGARRIAGVIDGEGGAKGLWPRLSTQGRLGVNKFEWDAGEGALYKLDAAKADWQLDTHDSKDAPVRVKVELNKAQAKAGAIEQASLQLDGTLTAHRARLLADIATQLPDQRKPTLVHAELAASGGMRADERSAVPSAWEGEIGQLLLRTGGLTPRVLLLAQPFKVRGNWIGDARGVVVSPVELNVLGAGVAVRSLSWRTASFIQDPTGDLDVDLQLTPLNLSTVLASWLPQAGWGGDLQLTGRFSLRHNQNEAWRVDAQVSRESGDLSLTEPTIEGNVVQRLGIRQAVLTLQSRGGVWQLNEQFDGRLFGQLNGRQTVTVSDPRRLPAPSDSLTGDLDVQIRNLRPWGAWLPAGWRLSGQMQAQAKLSGTLGVPQYVGTVDGSGLGLGQALLGVNITDGVLKMRLDGDHLYLDRLDARSGSQGGSVSATGAVSLVEAPVVSLSLKAERFGLLQRVDRRIMVSGNLNGLMDAEEIKVDGRVMVDEGLIDISRSDAPTVGDDVYVVNRPGDDDEAEDEEQGGSGASTRKVNASIDVDLGGKLKLRGRGLDAFLTGALQVTTPNNRPAIRGAVNVVDGTYAAYGQKMVIERGAVTFTGTIENPRLDILAMRAQSPTAASSDVKVGVNITGTAQDPRVRLYSEPDMSETEKLSWLVLGRAPTGLGGADLGLLQTAAVALLSGEGSSPSDNLVGKLGLDELSVRQTEGAVRDTVVNLGKQVSKYWYVGYERHLNETSGNWQLIYRLAQRFTVRAQAGDDNAVDLIWSWRWD